MVYDIVLSTLMVYLPWTYEWYIMKYPLNIVDNPLMVSFNHMIFFLACFHSSSGGELCRVPLTSPCVALWAAYVGFARVVVPWNEVFSEHGNFRGFYDFQAIFGWFSGDNCVILGEFQVIFRWFRVIFNDFLWVYMDYIYPNLWQLDSEHVDSPSHFGVPYFQTNDLKRHLICLKHKHKHDGFLPRLRWCFWSCGKFAGVTQGNQLTKRTSIFLKLDVFKSQTWLAFCGCIDTPFDPHWLMLLFGLAPTYLMRNPIESTIGSPSSQQCWGSQKVKWAPLTWALMWNPTICRSFP